MNSEMSRRRFLRSLGAGATTLAVSTTFGSVALAQARPGSGGAMLRYRLRAAPSRHRIAGRSIGTWSFNGSFPGPILRAQVGDQLTVNFINQLPDPSTIHWHGVEVPATADGSSISQLAVPPGGSYTYEFDALRPSLYWYHPHNRTNEQVERGLYGALLVQDPGEEQMLGVTPGNEHVLMLDDILLDDNGIAPPFPSDPLDNAVTHFNGRIGNVLLVNGQKRPSIRVRNGTPQRLRLVNTANSRFMRLSLPAGQRVWRVGGDGGLLTAPLEVLPIDMVMGGGHGGHGGHGMMSNPDLSRGVMLTPGERADLIWVPSGDNGDVVSMSWHDWPRGDHGAVYRPDGSIMITHDPTDGMEPPEALVDFRLVGQPAPGGDAYAPPSQLATISPLTPGSGTPVALTMGHGPPDAAGEVVFFLQRDGSGPQPFPVLTPDDVATVAPGEVRLFEVTNLTMGAHNFHLHGFFFHHIETQFIDMDNPANNRTVPAAHVENKDTILVPGRPGAPMRSRTVVRLAASFDDTGREGLVDAWGKSPTADRSGGWLMHCHLLEHSNSGMMSFVQVRT